MADHTNEIAALAHGTMNAVIAACDPAQMIDRRWPAALGDAPLVHVLALGKASPAMTGGALRRLRGRLGYVVVVCPAALAPGARESLPHAEVFVGDHPTPTGRSVAAAARVAGVCELVQPGEAVLVLISGGASSLVTLPVEGVSLEDVSAVSVALMRAGADIAQLNAVRKHVDRLKGGQLARALRGRRVVGLALSDVVGDAPDVIASGPLAPNRSTYAEALAVLDTFGVRRVAPAVTARLVAGARGDHPETPKPGDPDFDAVFYDVIGSNVDALAAAGEAMRRAGCVVISERRNAVGEARELGESLMDHAIAEHARGSKRVCFLAGGETTVSVGDGGGRGGPCQEAALAAALKIDARDRLGFFAFSTDGADGPTEAAGAWADHSTADRIRHAGIDPARALARHDSSTALAAVGGLIRTGPTGTNVNDVYAAVVL